MTTATKPLSLILKLPSVHIGTFFSFHFLFSKGTFGEMKTLVKKGGKLRQQSDIKTSGWKKQPQFPFFIHFEHNIPSAWYVVLIVGAINRKMRRYGISGAESGNVGALIITRGKRNTIALLSVRPLLLHGEDQQQAAVRPLMNIVLSRIRPGCFMIPWWTIDPWTSVNECPFGNILSTNIKANQLK